jgi:hypothetical protein
MNALRYNYSISLLAVLLAGYAGPAAAQVPVDDSGAPLATYEPMDEGATEGNEQIPLLTRTELQDLVGPVALYPDDLLAVVLPASTFPLQLVEAQRFLEALEEDPSLSPDEDWDDSIVALLNYPEIVELLNKDLDWTWQLGEAVVAQQEDVVAAVESFRDRAYAAGNLRSDSHQSVARNEGTIEITPVEDDVIYVPYYEPESVVVYQPRPVYYYYPRAYPVYYYPYPEHHAFNRTFNSGFFWGVTTAYTVGWLTDSVHVLHHSYHGHPYYGHSYRSRWWYRRPSVHVHNNYYTSSRHSVSRHRYSHGDYWRPRHESRRRLSNQRITRSSYYANRSDGAVSHRTERRTAHTTTARGQSAQRTRNATQPRRQNYTGTSSTNRREPRPAIIASATPRRTPTATRNSRADRAQRREVVQPRTTQAVQTRRQDVRRSDNRGNESGNYRQGSRQSSSQSNRQNNRGNDSRANARREAPPARQQTSRNSERQSGERKKQQASDRRSRSSGTKARRQRD